MEHQHKMNLKELLSNKRAVVIDNFLDLEINNNLQETILNSRFPFFYSQETVKNTDRQMSKLTNEIESGQFTHIVIDKRKGSSPYLDQIHNMLFSKIHLLFNNELNFYRAKINLKLPHPKANLDSFDIPHTDVDSKSYSMIYYINDTDGDTFFFDDNGNIVDRINPTKNRLLIFDSCHKHAAGFPVIHNNRVVINMVIDQ